VTHGAVSHQIRTLEDRLGVKLFSRAHNRLTLTPAGHRLHASVKAGFDIIVEGTRNLNPQELSGSLVVACTQTMATCWANTLITQFYEKYPTINITVKEIEPRQKEIPNDIDVAICYGKPIKDDRELIMLASPPLYPVCNPRLLQKQERNYRPKDIYQFTLLHDTQISWSRWLAHYKVEEPADSSHLYFPNTSQALSVACSGYGVALGNTFETKDFIEEGRLVHLLSKSTKMEHDYYLLSQPEEIRSLKSQIFVEWIMDRSENRK